MNTGQLEKIQKSTTIIRAKGCSSTVSFANLMFLKLPSQLRKLKKIQQF